MTEPLKIEILEEESPLQPEIPPQRPPLAQRAAETAVAATQQAWQSETRKKATSKLSAGAAKSAQFVQEKVAAAAAQQARTQMAATQERLRRADWKQLLQNKTAAALRWSSARLQNLAARISAPVEKSPDSRSGDA
jgi:hypothetical protein